MRLHAAGDIHGVAPKVVGEFLGPDDAGNDGPAVHADADAPVELVAAVENADGLEHLEGGVGAGLGVVAAHERHAADHHVGVADGLDLLDFELLGDAVEAGENLVEELDGAVRRLLAGDAGEADDVGEEDGGVDETVDNGALAGLEALGDGLGQDVEEEALGLGAFDLQLGEVSLLLIAQALFF